MTRSAGASPRAGDSAGPTPEHTITIKYCRTRKRKYYLPQIHSVTAHITKAWAIQSPDEREINGRYQERRLIFQDGPAEGRSVGTPGAAEGDKESSSASMRKGISQILLRTLGYSLEFHYYHSKTFTKTRKSENSTWSNRKYKIQGMKVTTKPDNGGQINGPRVFPLFQKITLFLVLWDLGW